MQKNVGRGLVGIVLVSILFFGAPQKSYAIFGLGDISWDTIQDIFGGVTIGTTGVTAATSGTTAVLTGSQWVKSFVLDGIANQVARQIIKKLTAQTVNWINSGFKGNPAYVTDPSKFFLNIGDSVAGNFLSSSPTLNALCTPFQAQVRLALVKNYINETESVPSCTISKVIANYDAFTRDFSQGGWEGWISVTQNSQNNPYGAYLGAKDTLSIQIANKTVLKDKELTQGNGFLSYKKCTQWSAPSKIAQKQSQLDSLAGSSDANSPENLQQQNLLSYQLRIDKAQTAYTALTVKTNPVATPAELNAANREWQDAKQALEDYKERQGLVSYSGDSVDFEQNNPDEVSEGDIGTDGRECTKVETVTPGSVIASQLNNVVKSPVAQLELTNSINQIVSALMTQMVQQVVGGIGNGLRGVSQKNNPSSSTGKSLTDQLTSPATDDTREDEKIANDRANFATSQDNQNKADAKDTQKDIPTREQVEAQNKVDMSGQDAYYNLGQISTGQQTETQDQCTQRVRAGASNIELMSSQLLNNRISQECGVSNTISNF